MKKINFVNNDAPYLSAENLNQMQDNIEEAINGNIIWENPNPTSDFEEKTINLDLTGYRMFFLTFRNRKDDDAYTCTPAQKGLMQNVMFVGWIPSVSKDISAVRHFNIQENHIYIGKTYGYGIGDHSGFHENITDVLIPYQIIGYK